MLQLKCSRSADTFLMLRLRLNSCPALQPSHLTSLRHSRPSLQAKCQLTPLSKGNRRDTSTPGSCEAAHFYRPAWALNPGDTNDACGSAFLAPRPFGSALTDIITVWYRGGQLRSTATEACNQHLFRPNRSCIVRRYWI